MRHPDPLDALRRADKHYLGAGDGILFDPPHPLWLDRPGFWDGGRVFLYSLTPLFTLTLVEPGGGELDLEPVARSWTPAEIVARYRAGAVAAEERRVVLPGGVFASEWRLRNQGSAPVWLHAVAWTAQEGTDVPERGELRGVGGSVRFLRQAADAQGRSEGLTLECELAIEAGGGDVGEGAGGEGAGMPGVGSRAAGPATWAVMESQHMRGYPNPPWWTMAPFRDGWTEEGLPCSARTAEAPAGRTLLYAAVALPLRLPPGGQASLVATLRALPHARALRPASAGGRLPASPSEASRAAWRGYFAGAPALACSDPWIERYFAYRWYGLRLNFLGPAGNYRHPTVAEGVEYFHCPISYSAWCHARELRWLPDPTRARGTLRTFFDHQADDGALPGRVYLDHGQRTDFYFADWGGALDALEEAHPDRAFLEEAYGPLGRYADWLDRERDPERTGTYEVRDPYETGQENTSRYTAVDPGGDLGHFEYRLRLRGVDLTVYAYRLRRALARAAASLGRPADVRAHDAVGERIGEAIRTRMWDPERELFFDLRPDDLTPTGVRAAVCFYPFMTDVPGPEHLAALERHLFDAGAFWLPFPVPTSAADDPGFSAGAEWRGVRRNCAWNGRVWPMSNSHVVEALGHAATHLDPGLRGRLAELLRTYVEMMFFDGDPARPNCFEHYSPLTGRPATYRGLDDYQHSWVNDLLIRFVAGVRPAGARHLVVDPFPFGLERLRLQRLPWRGAELEVDIEGELVQVRLNGARVAAGPLGERLVVEL